MSLPSRERGLKSTDRDIGDLRFTSLPSRERGLKYKTQVFQKKMDYVAPFAGAWIEIVLIDPIH